MMTRPAAPLPSDFPDVFAAAVREGVLGESAPVVRQRAVLAIDATGRATGRRPRHPTPATWATDVLSELELAIRAEICAADASGLKPDYEVVLDGLLTPEGIAELTAVVLKLVQSIDPALAVSSIGLYIAVWLLKIGLNRWCVIGRSE